MGITSYQIYNVVMLLSTLLFFILYLVGLYYEASNRYFIPPPIYSTGYMFSTFFGITLVNLTSGGGINAKVVFIQLFLTIASIVSYSIDIGDIMINDSNGNKFYDRKQDFWGDGGSTFLPSSSAVSIVVSNIGNRTVNEQYKGFQSYTSVSTIGPFVLSIILFVYLLIQLHFESGTDNQWFPFNVSARSILGILGLFIPFSEMVASLFWTLGGETPVMTNFVNRFSMFIVLCIYAMFGTYSNEDELIYVTTLEKGVYYFLVSLNFLITGIQLGIDINQRIGENSLQYFSSEGLKFDKYFNYSSEFSYMYTSDVSEQFTINHENSFGSLTIMRDVLTVITLSFVVIFFFLLDFNSEKIEDAIEDARDKFNDTIENVGDKFNDTIENVGENLEESMTFLQSINNV